MVSRGWVQNITRVNGSIISELILLSVRGVCIQAIAEARIAITQCRQLCYLAACVADEKGFKEARKYIAIVKVQAPRQALQIVDEAIQLHGAAGLSQDSTLSDMYMSLRTLRVADVGCFLCLLFLGCTL